MFPVWFGCEGISPNLWDFPTQPSLLLSIFNLNLTVGMTGGAHALAYAITNKKGGVTEMFSSVIYAQ